MEASTATRPAAIAEAPDLSKTLAECTPVELMMVALREAEGLRNAESGPAAREFALAATHIEDAITRYNKGVYRVNGVFSVTDADRTRIAAGEAEA